MTRRALLGGAAAGIGAAGIAGLVKAIDHSDRTRTAPGVPEHVHGANLTVGEVSTRDFDPYRYLTDFDYGEVSTLPNGQTLREYQINAVDRDIEIAPGIEFPAWTYNGQVPGPTLRCTQGDRIRIVFQNDGSHPHTIHFHGIHSAEMDGVPGIGAGDIRPGEQTVYEFDAEPFGCHLYHCHSLPLKRHIHKGLYGAFIIDPPEGRPPANEMVMMLNAFDTSFDGENEVYAVNTKAFAYMANPIRMRAGELQRIYLINITEFDPINSIHIHANFFQYYPTGTSLEPAEFTDTKMLSQGERGIVEFQYDIPGMYMFHAHQSEFAELGWMGFFNVAEDGSGGGSGAGSNDPPGSGEPKRRQARLDEVLAAYEGRLGNGGV